MKIAFFKILQSLVLTLFYSLSFSQSLKAGAAEVNITPPIGTLVNGGFATGYARTIHDSLHTKALVLKNKKITVALVVVDICEMLKDFIDATKSQIQKETGIPPANILISSTHAHSAGAVESDFLAFADLAYRKKLPGQIVQAVKKAQQNVRPAQIAFGAVDAPEHVVCRRYFMKEGYEAKNPVSGQPDKVKTNPFGDEKMIDRAVNPVDPQLSYLAVKGLDNQWISLLANYSLHYVGDWQEGTISADYFGEFSSRVKQKLNGPDDFVVMMSNGTSGDVNIVDFLHPGRYPEGDFKKTAVISEDLAQKVKRSLSGLSWQKQAVLASYVSNLPLAIRRPAPEEVAEAKKVVEQTDFSKIWENGDGMKQLFAYEQVMLNEFPDTILFVIQAIKIGDGTIGGLGGEIFAETGLWLKKQSKLKHYFIIGLANGYVGYVPPAKDIELGGYETWRCRTSYLEKNAEEKIKKELLRLINRTR
jgi:hypothetical protein